VGAVAAGSDLLERLRAVGDERYHDKHPFHRRLVAGELMREQVRAWITNRYAYQKVIPIKDAYILAHLPTREYRRAWIKRIYDHDGTPGESEGGTLQWLALARAAGIGEDEVLSEREVSAGARFAADAYVEFCRTRPWLEAVAASLTELFGPPVMERRVAAIVEKYPWIDPEGLAYFRKRIVLAPADAQQALSWVLEHARTAEQQDACVAALRFKCDVLWSLLDATALASGVFA
jgi:pyrroloquinoline-quinone synthase